MAAKKVDTNQAQIVEALRAIGASVADIHECGKGKPDIAVGFRGFECLMEIKQGDARLTAAEEEFRRTWQGRYFVVRDAEEAIAILQYHTREA